jgi:hypothetical protein
MPAKALAVCCPGAAIDIRFLGRETADMANRIVISLRPGTQWRDFLAPAQRLARVKGQVITIALGLVVGPAAEAHAACGPYMPWDTVGQATCADLDQPPAPAIDPRLVPLYAGALADALDRNQRESDAILERWRAEDAERHAAPGIAVPVPADGRARSYHNWDSSGMRWGTVEVQPSGDWRTWDSRSGLRWGYLER